MNKVRVGVLRGGPSSEYEVSLKTGGEVIRYLPEEKYQPVDVFIDRTGAWHYRGIPIEPARLFPKVDVVFNALHGAYGEDGTVQKFLDAHKMPYTGSGALSSAIAMNKPLAKEYLKNSGIKIAAHRLVDAEHASEREILELFRTFPQPSVVKPYNGGSSVGVTIAKSFEALLHGIKNLLVGSEKVLVEEYIPGREATVAVVDNFRGESRYVLPPIEIIPAKNRGFFDYAAKYQGESQEICPGNFSKEEKKELERLARIVHETFGLQHYSRSDFIISPRGIYFLETNTLPGLTSASLVPKALLAVGCSFPDFLDHLVTLALTR